MENLGSALVGGIIFAVICGLIGKNRKIGAGWGAVLGFFLSLIGLIIVLCSKKNEPEFKDMSKNNQ